MPILLPIGGLYRPILASLGIRRQFGLPLSRVVGEVCKTFIVGSIPTVASVFFKLSLPIRHLCGWVRGTLLPMNTKPKIAAVGAAAATGIAAVVVGVTATHATPVRPTASSVTTSGPAHAANGADATVPTADATPIAQDTPTPVPTDVPTPTASPTVLTVPAVTSAPNHETYTCPSGYRAVFGGDQWSCVLITAPSPPPS